MDQVRLSLSALAEGESPRIDGLDQGHVEALADVEARSLPPVVVCRSSGVVIDGHHRVAAAVRRGDSEIEAQLFDGTPEAAFVFAVRANIRHGLPLNKGERELAVTRIISSHPHLSDRAIAVIAGVSAKTVAARRGRSTAAGPHSTTRVGMDGRRRPVSGVAGRLRAAEIINAAPETSLREVAAQAGISVATAHDVHKRLREGGSPVPDRGRPAADNQPAKTLRERCPVDRLAVMRVLRKDPSLRLTEAGRHLLRWLDVQAAPNQSDTMAAAVPSHCVDLVVGVVRQQAHDLIRFADDLQRRHITAGGCPDQQCAAINWSP